MHHAPRLPSRRAAARRLAPLLCSLALLTACGDAALREAPVANEDFATAQRLAPATAARIAEHGFDVAGGTGRPAIAQDSATRMLIRRGAVFVRVDSLESAMVAVRDLAARLGGHVGNVTVNAGEFQVRSATLQLRIPAARFDAATGGLDSIGRVESSSITAEDVGEEFVDVSARMANGRRLEERLVTLLRTQAGKLEDVLAVERELARVRQEIESYEARIRYLRSNVAMSTLEVTVSERAPLVSPNPGQGILGQSFLEAWRNFLRLIAFVIESLGFLVPLVALVLVWRQISRRRRRVE